MILAFNIGNSEIKVGVFDGEQLRGEWRLTTNVPRTPDELGFALVQIVAAAGASASDIDGVAVCSVVPTVTPAVVQACADRFAVEAVLVDAHAQLPITLDVDEPASVGADRIANTLAASCIHHRDVIVVDLGTATTYDCITAEGSFFGGVIQPGVRVSAETLFTRTSLLPATGLVEPIRVIGTNTVDCINAGVVFGAADSIDGLIRRIKREWPTAAVPYVVATGGLATLFRSYCTEFDEVDPTLTMKGVRMAYALLSR